MPGFNFRSSFRSTRLRVALVSAKWTHSALIHKKAGNWWHRSGEKFVEDCRGKIGATAISNLETWAGEEHILRSYANGPWALHGLPCWDISKSVRPFNGAKPPHRLPIRNDNGTKMSWLYYLKTSFILLCLKPVGRWITLTRQWLPCWELGPKTSAPSTASSGVEQNSTLSSCASWRCDGDSMVMLGFPWFPYNLLHTVCLM